MKTLTLIATAATAIAVATPALAGAHLDTLGLNVTFVGDREVLMRDAHKEMHWPEPAVIGLQKPEFTYSVLPKRLSLIHI